MPEPPCRRSDTHALQIGQGTVRRYLDLLEQLFLIRQLRPWHENLRKRQVKRPKLYFRDTGLYHHLLGIGTLDELHRHPKIGASWEGFIIEKIAFEAERISSTSGRPITAPSSTC